jgi:hypothetical protein
VRRRFHTWFDSDPLGNSITLYLCYLLFLGAIALTLAWLLG